MVGPHPKAAAVEGEGVVNIQEITARKATKELWTFLFAGAFLLCWVIVAIHHFAVATSAKDAPNLQVQRLESVFAGRVSLEQQPDRKFNGFQSDRSWVASVSSGGDEHFYFIGFGETQEKAVDECLRDGIAKLQQYLEAKSREKGQ